MLCVLPQSNFSRCNIVTKLHLTATHMFSVHSLSVYALHGSALSPSNTCCEVLVNLSFADCISFCGDNNRVRMSTFHAKQR